METVAVVLIVLGLLGIGLAVVILVRLYGQVARLTAAAGGLLTAALRLRRRVRTAARLVRLSAINASVAFQRTARHPVDCG